MGNSLMFGDLELIDGDFDDAFKFETLADGFSFGEPQPVEAAIASLLRDGALTQTERDGNREVSFLVTVSSTDPNGLAQGVAALHGLVGKRSTLRWQPEDYPATVFDVETSSLHAPNGFNDLDHMAHRETVRLRLVCLPYARSESKVVDDADTPAFDGGTLLNNCESIGQWSKWQSGKGSGGPSIGIDQSIDGVVFVEGAGSAKCHAEYGYSYGGGYWQFGSSDRISGLSMGTASGGYLSVAIKVAVEDEGVRLLSLYMHVAGQGVVTVPPERVIATGRDDQGFVRFAWAVDAGLTVTGLDFYVFQGSQNYRESHQSNPSPLPYVWYDDIRLLNSATTDHQILKQLEVLGSARTTGAIHVAAPADSVPLGDVLVITAPTNALPTGYTPDGRRWATQGTLTPDADALYGDAFTPAANYVTTEGYPIFDIPVSMFTPGAYRVVAHLKPGGTYGTRFGVQAQLRLGGVDTGEKSEAEASLTGVSAVWQFFTVGTIYLPPTPITSPDVSDRVRLLFRGAVFSEIYLIPAWQEGGRPVADFSIVACGTGTVSSAGASSHLWIDTPSTAQPQGGWWRGPAEGRVGARSAWPDAKKPGVHALNPGMLTTFVVSTGAQGPRVELEYFPAWFGSAAL